MPEKNIAIGTIRIVGRADHLDLEQVTEAVHGRFWELMDLKIRGMMTQQRETLAHSDDDRKIARAQGAVQALERVLQLPEILRKEVQERATSK